MRKRTKEPCQLTPKKLRSFRSGRCIRCHKNPLRTKYHCEGCAKAMSLYEGVRALQAKEAGICVRCKECIAQPGKSVCVECRDECAMMRWMFSDDRNFRKARAVALRIRQRRQKELDRIDDMIRVIQSKGTT